MEEGLPAMMDKVPTTLGDQLVTSSLRSPEPLGSIELDSLSGLSPSRLTSHFPVTTSYLTHQSSVSCLD